MNKTASIKRVATRYIKADLKGVPNSFTLPPEVAKALFNHYSEISYFAHLKVPQVALESVSWLVESSLHIDNLITEITHGVIQINHMVKDLHAKRPKNDGSNEWKQTENLFMQVSKHLDSFYHSFTQTYDNSIGPAILALSPKAKGFFKFTEKTPDLYKKVAEGLIHFMAQAKNTIKELELELVNLAEAITDEGAREAAKELNPGGVGGFFKKLFRRASMTLIGQFTDKTQAMLHKIEPFGFEALHSSAIYEGFKAYLELGLAQKAYYNMIITVQQMHSKADLTPFTHFLYANLKLFRNFSYPLAMETEPAHLMADSASFHVAQLNAVKFLKTYDTLPKFW